MDWDCTRTEERLSDALAETLGSEESAAFQAHAGGCERCKQLLARVGGMVVELHELPWMEEPPFLASRILALTRGAPPEHVQKGWLAWPGGVWQTRLVMGLVTIAATALIVFHGLSAGAPGKLQFNPANLYHGVNRRAHLTYARGVKFVNDLRVVYEIQSRLSSQPEPAPPPAPEQRRPDSDALPQSENNTMARDSVVLTGLAVLMFPRGPQNLLDQTSRSLL
ncbi:MAG TPA: zf-HC2 domain-containing protein [Candidatus Acidoferrum sp.]|jgi:hypothetical protein|nr:zf-HC2 domain-containing protein [Candidatus Acidoferrum sp.]